MSRSTDPERRSRPDSLATSPVTHSGRAVVGFDGTDASRDALAYAVGWARRVHGHLDVLFVTDDAWRWVAEACAAGSGVTALCDGVTDLSGVVTDLLADTDLPWSYHTATGGTVHALEAHAARVDADAIIVGRRRRRHGHRASIAHRLVSGTDRIVIVVP